MLSPGMCVALGIGTGRLIEEILRQSELSVLVVDDNAGAVDAHATPLRRASVCTATVSPHSLSRKGRLPCPHVLPAWLCLSNRPAIPRASSPTRYRNWAGFSVPTAVPPRCLGTTQRERHCWRLQVRQTRTVCKSIRERLSPAESTWAFVGHRCVVTRARERGEWQHVRGPASESTARGALVRRPGRGNLR